VIALLVAGEVNWGCHFWLNHSPPNELITVVIGAPISPQPGNPRSTMPYWFWEGLFNFCAND